MHLENCPFDGSEVKLWKGYQENLSSIFCPKCKTHFFFSHQPENSIKMWNSRAVPKREFHGETDSIGKPWIGVDLDGTLVHYDKWVSVEHLGKPIIDMVERIKVWLAEGKDVRIFTARVCPQQTTENTILATKAIRRLCIKLFGKPLPITCVKDWAMVELWDDRAIQVIKNTGKIK